MIKDDVLLPCTVDKSGEGVYIGMDNTIPVIIYHKINSISSVIKPKGTGDALGDIVNTYSNTMIVYMSRKKTGLLPDQLILKIQASLPDFLQFKPYNNIVIRFLNVILNSNQVWASEYGGSKYRLTPESNLFAINYQIETTFAKKCFENCC